MSSAVKFQGPPYKLFEPDYHPQKPIIVGEDDRLDSPETLTLRYEEAVRAAHGADPRGGSPPRFLDMATYSKAPPPSMSGYDPARYHDTTYDPYPAPTYDHADKFAQLNQQSFASNNAVSPYLSAAVAVLSCQPTSGDYGTKMFVRVSSQYDLFSISSPMPYFYMLFGSHRSSMQDVSRDGQDQDGSCYFYSCTVDVPQLLVTGCSSSNVPLSLVVEGPSGEEISRTMAGSFQYTGGPAGDITRADKMPTKHDTAAPPATTTQQQPGQANASPKSDDGDVVVPGVSLASSSSDHQAAGTNTYDYPTTQQSAYGHHHQQHHQHAFGASGASSHTPGNDSMISTYRTTNFAEPHYSRRHGHAWSYGALGRGTGLDGLGRPGLASLPSLPSSSTTTSHGGAPQLVRTSTITSGPGGNSPYHHMSVYSNKAVLKINGNLESMAEKWTPEEWASSRRIVMFRKSQQGSTLTASFRAVPVAERPSGGIFVSCIWWAEKGQAYVTSVDTIYLLEQLLAHPSRFSVDEKNRIRRNLEGFHPLTVSKSKADSEEFFKLIMGFPAPKPRNIEKDVKVFPWKTLESALKKIIGKYSASPSGSMAPSMPSGASTLMTPMSSSAYAPLPTPPAHHSSMASSHAQDSHAQYGIHPSLHSQPHHDSIPSPRSLTGSQTSWAPYTSTATGQNYPAPSSSRALSPGGGVVRQASPHAPSMRLSTTTTATTALPALTTYDTRSVSTNGGGGGYSATGLHTPISHPASASTPPRWDATSVSYADDYPSLTTGGGHHGGPSGGQAVYGSGGYGDRA